MAAKRYFSLSCFVHSWEPCVAFSIIIDFYWICGTSYLSKFLAWNCG